MKNLNDFTFDDDYRKIKKDSVDQLMQEPKVIKILQMHGLNRSFVEEHWNDFVTYVDSYQNPTTDLVKEMIIENNKVNLISKPSEKGSEIMTNDLILKNMLLNDLNPEYVLRKQDQLFLNPYRQEIMLAIQKVISQETETGIFLWGRGRHGKTTLLAFLMGNLALRGYRCGIIHFPTYLVNLKNGFEGYNPEPNLVKEVDYLLIDDLGDENSTKWSQNEVLHTILRYRLQNDKVTFFTSNYNLNELRKLYLSAKNDSLKVERLLETIKDCAKIIELKG